MPPAHSHPHAGGGPARSLLLDGIGELVTCDPDGWPDATAAPDVAALGIRHDAALVVADGQVAWIGRAADAPAADERLDCAGGAVLPGFVDSHAHLVFAGDRAAEFAARMAGRPYAAGGIASTVAATRAASDDALRANLARLVGELHAAGVTTFEVKSGYGLTVAEEARACRLAAEVTEEVTFLGAHVVPAECAGDRAGYLDLLTGPMLAASVPHARWADVFVDRGAFDAIEAHVVLDAAARAGLGLRVHANQLGHGPGAALAAAHGAASADHCTHLRRRDIAALAEAGTVATLLPAAELGTRSPFPDARRLLAAGVTVALATDCNPGTSYTTAMPLVIALAVSGMRMTPAEAVHAATSGGAAALRRTDVGRITVGGPADLLLLDAPSHVHLAYRPGVDLVAGVWRGGRAVGRATSTPARAADRAAGVTASRPGTMVGPGDG